MEDQTFEIQLPGEGSCATAAANGDRAASEFESSTYQLPSNGDAAIATCTTVENSCSLHGFEDAEMMQGQGEWRIMVQIGCRCPMHLQDIFLQHVRGFKVQGPRDAGRLARSAHGSGGGGLSWSQQRQQP
jgi:hypothetical protein